MQFTKITSRMKLSKYLLRTTLVTAFLSGLSKSRHPSARWVPLLSPEEEGPFRACDSGDDEPFSPPAFNAWCAFDSTTEGRLMLEGVDGLVIVSTASVFCLCCVCVCVCFPSNEGKKCVRLAP